MKKILIILLATLAVFKVQPFIFGVMKHGIVKKGATIPGVGNRGFNTQQSKEELMNPTAPTASTKDGLFGPPRAMIKLQKKIKHALDNKKQLKAEVEQKYWCVLQYVHADIIGESKRIYEKYSVDKKLLSDGIIPENKKGQYQAEMNELFKVLIESKNFNAIKVFIVYEKNSADLVYDYYQTIDDKKEWEDLFICLIPFYSESVIQEIKSKYL